jgi:hypothetical protein
MPHPIHSSSLIKAILDSGFTSMQSFPERSVTKRTCQKSKYHLPILFTGHDFLHSCLHFLGLQRSVLTIAIRVNLSVINVTRNWMDVRTPLLLQSNGWICRKLGSTQCPFCVRTCKPIPIIWNPEFRLQYELYPYFSHSVSHLFHPSLGWPNLTCVLRQPIVTGTSVLAIKYADGIMMAADCLGKTHFHM